MIINLSIFTDVYVDLTFSRWDIATRVYKLFYFQSLAI